jgi:WD40 repeat protein
VATTGADGVLRIWSYPELEQLLPAIPVSWTAAFTNCYCTQRFFAPVAWSPDGHLLATPDTDHNSVVRRACDGQILATLEPATSAQLSPTPQGPAFLAFTPRGDGLAVFHMGSVAFYRLYR